MSTARKLACSVVLGFEDPSLVSQRISLISRDLVYQVLRFSFTGCFTPFTNLTNCRSDRVLRALKSALHVLAPPFQAKLSIERDTMYLSAPPTTEETFVLAFPLNELSASAHSLLEDLRADPHKCFRRVKRKRSVLAQDARETFLDLSDCKFDSEISEGLAICPFMHVFLHMFRESLDSDQGNTWGIFQTLLDSCAQDSNAKPSFVHYYRSYVRSWDDLRQRGTLPSIMNRCWLTEVASARAAHLTCLRQRKIMTDLFVLGNLRYSSAKESDSQQDVAIIAGFSVLNQLVLDKRAGSACHQGVPNKPVLQALHMWACNGHQSLLQRAIAADPELSQLLAVTARQTDAKDVYGTNTAAFAMSCAAFVYAPQLLAPLRRSCKLLDAHKSKRLKRAVQVFLLVCSEMSVTVGGLDLDAMHWFAIYLLMRRDTLNAPTADVLARYCYSPAFVRLQNVPPEPTHNAAKLALDNVTDRICAAVVAEFDAPKHTQSEFSVQLEPWRTGQVELLANTVRRSCMFYELQAISRLTQKNLVVHQLRDGHAGLILSAEHTLHNTEITAVQLGTSLLLVGTPECFEDIVMPYAARQPATGYEIDVLAWAICQHDTATAIAVLCARYSEPASSIGLLHILFEQVLHKWTDLQGDVDSRFSELTAEACVRALLSNDPSILDKPLPMTEPQLKVLVPKKHTRLDFCRDVPADTRRLAAWLLRVQYRDTDRRPAIFELTFPLTNGPLSHLCNGTTGSVNHALWSARPDLLRVVAQALR
jgi:hypothetical protein